MRDVPWRKDLAAAAVCVVVGVVMSVMPHLLWWTEYGGPFWIADEDEVYYLQFTGQAYDNHPTHLGDPIMAAPSRSAYSAVSLVPGILVAKWLGAGPLAAPLWWRLTAGFGVGLMSYVLLRQVLGRPWMALPLACVMLTDSGMLTCHLFIKQWITAARILGIDGATTDLLSANPRIHPEWRVVNPGPSWPFLMLHVWLMIRARVRPTNLRIVLAGMGYGLLFYIYFYYFTAASVALVVALAIDKGQRKLYAETLMIGGLIGAPGVLTTYLFKQSTPADWLHRTDKFLPIPHLSQLMIPWVACGLLGIGLIWIALRRKDLIYVGVLAGVGICLANHQVVTGLQIENFHWIFVWGLMTSYLIVMLAAGELVYLNDRGRCVLAALVVVQVSLGIWLRWVEVTKTRESVALAADYARFRTEILKPLTPNVVMAGDPKYVQFATIILNQRPLTGYAATLSPYVDNASWNERAALNAYLLGRSATEFEADQRQEFEAGHWGPWGRDPEELASQVARRVAAYQEVERDPVAAIDRDKVEHVVLPAGTALPTGVEGTFVVVHKGSKWDIWKLGNASTIEGK